MSSRFLAAGLLLALVASGCDAGPSEPASRDAGCVASPAPGGGCATGTPTTDDGPTSPPAKKEPLAGRVVVLDPGHQLGNHRFPSQINALVDAGGFEKPCNTTGTATDDGYPEATFTWRVALATRTVLRRLGAKVVLTRAKNSEELWGPCVDERGTIGNPGTDGPLADLRLSIHGDGSLSDADHGFHVIRPGDLVGWTDDIVRPSRRLARVVRDRLVAAGFEPSTYRGDDGIDVRTDLGTLNRSDVPAVMVELGNMRSADDAAVMVSKAGQRRYGRALARAIEKMLTR